MAKFINETLGMVNPKDFLSTGFQNVARPNDPLEGLFTDERTDNLVASYYTMQSQYNIPQMAQFHAFDVPAQKSIPAPIDEHNVEKGLIKVKRSTTELLRQLTLAPRFLPRASSPSMRTTSTSPLTTACPLPTSP